MKKIKNKTYRKLSGRILYYVVHSSARTAVRWFNILNPFVWRWPIRVRIDESGLINVEGEGQSVRIGRPERIPKFAKGIPTRLRNIRSKYQIQEIPGGIADGDVIIDVGANVGEFGMALQSMADVRVVAIEPEESEFVPLRMNLGETAHCYNELLWNEETVLKFHSLNESGDSSIFQPDESVEGYEYPATTLDRIASSDSYLSGGGPIKVLKVEAEGAEPEILAGASELLQRCEYVTVDCGPERGLEKETTLIQVIEVMQRNDFRPITFGHPRMVLLFRKGN